MLRHSATHESSEREITSREAGPANHIPHMYNTSGMPLKREGGRRHHQKKEEVDPLPQHPVTQQPAFRPVWWMRSLNIWCERVGVCKHGPVWKRRPVARHPRSDLSVVSCSSTVHEIAVGLSEPRSEVLKHYRRPPCNACGAPWVTDTYPPCTHASCMQVPVQSKLQLGCEAAVFSQAVEGQVLDLGTAEMLTDSLCDLQASYPTLGFSSRLGSFLWIVKPW